VPPSSGCRVGSYTGSFNGTISVLGGAPADISGQIQLDMTSTGNASGTIQGADVSNNPIDGAVAVTADCSGKSRRRLDRWNVHLERHSGRRARPAHGDVLLDRRCQRQLRPGHGPGRRARNVVRHVERELLGLVIA